MSALALWVVFNLFILILLAVDLGILHRQITEITLKNAFLSTLFYIVISIIFGIGVYYFNGYQSSLEFFTGYLIEKSLSLDNLFVFSLIFHHFQTPSLFQHRVLYWGILWAIILRAIMIYAGAALIHKFHVLNLLLSWFLMYTGLKMFWKPEQKIDIAHHPMVHWLNKHVSLTRTYHDTHFFVRQKKSWKVTPLFLVLMMIEVMDVVFAVDSIPAIFAVTSDPFIMYSSNIFAILGLRALYFVLAASLPRFYYLKYGLAAVLIFIGFKLHYGSDYITTQMSLAITAGLIFGSVFISMLKPRFQR